MSIQIEPARCCGDELCVKVCPAQCLRMKGSIAAVAPLGEPRCIRCGQCVAICPKAAITLDDVDPATLPRVEAHIAPEIFRNFAQSRRSIRAYRNKALPRDILEEALDVARYAPTGSNQQNVQWIAVDGDNMRIFAERIVNALRGTEALQSLIARFDKGEDVIFRGAPCAVFAWSESDYDLIGADCAIAVTYLELTLHSMGLGSCWAGYALRALRTIPSVKEFLNLPPNGQIHSALMVGYPALRYQRIPARKPLRLTWA